MRGDGDGVVHEKKIEKNESNRSDDWHGSEFVADACVSVYIPYVLTFLVN